LDVDFEQIETTGFVYLSQFCEYDPKIVKIVLKNVENGYTV